MDPLDFLIEAEERGLYIDPPPRVPIVVPKGQCVKCGRHIGRGIWRHEKNCRGQ